MSGPVFIEFGTPDVGLWCDHCATPSAYAMPLSALRADGVKGLGFQAVKCADCGRGKIEETQQ